ncbi:WD40 repeat-like protein [Hesseltinella vesiculosa]|uniref:WD40 repeat-like protein n=1 Tax=Hesseltinella vesiculosa TaxID=101127 RepID=A0A1X2GMX5_9FUNG|nr:WD40 repeat-like protein [Hesseltinella vesiculosa]
MAILVVVKAIHFSLYKRVSRYPPVTLRRPLLRPRHPPPRSCQLSAAPCLRTSAAPPSHSPSLLPPPIASPRQASPKPTPPLSNVSLPMTSSPRSLWQEPVRTPIFFITVAPASFGWMPLVNPTCHDVNLLTRGADHLDIIIGFSSGDIVWFDPLCNKYGRLNKGGAINSSGITMIRWLQGSENLVMAAFQDGTVILFDKDKEDGPFHAADSLPTSPSAHDPPELNSPWAFHQQKFGSPPSSSPSTHDKPTRSSLTKAKASKQMFRVSRPASKNTAKHNPVSHWKLSNQSITAFAFSPDCQHVAVVGLDGYLRVINYLQEKLQDVYESYYGGLLCAAWSPDGRYILTGGQDDLVTIWAFREQRIVARCQGHSSWVTNVAFDSWRCDERVYRFASVGEDAKLILWDFSVSAIHRPKARSNARHRGASVSSMTHPTIKQAQEPSVKLHPVISKADVAILQPAAVNTVHADPCVGVYFREDVIVTTDKRGRVCSWKRP